MILDPKKDITSFLLECFDSKEKLDDLWYLNCKISCIVDNFLLNKISVDESNLKNYIIEFTSSIINSKFIQSFAEDLKLFINSKEGIDLINDDIEAGRRMRLKLNVIFFMIIALSNKKNKDEVLKLRSIITNFIQKIKLILGGTYTYLNILLTLAKILEDKEFEYNSTFPRGRLGRTVNTDLMFNINQEVRIYLIIAFYSISNLGILSEAMAKGDKIETHISNKLNNIYGKSAMIEGRIKEDKLELKEFVDFFRTTNEQIVSFLIFKLSSGFKITDHVGELKKTFEENVKSKLQNISQIKEEIINYCIKKFIFFSNSDDGSEYQRSNKCFIITIQLLSTLELLKLSNNQNRITQTVRWCYTDWFKNMHMIINRNNLIDEYLEIEKYVIEEDDEIERKSSFKVGTQCTEQDQFKKSDELLEKIAKSIIGMFNSKGGTIIVGLCEKSQSITNPFVIQNIITKKGKSFFDVSRELELLNTDLDEIRRSIQDKIRRETGLSIDIVDDLRNISPVELIDDSDASKKAIIFKIAINKSNNLVFSFTNVNDKVSVSLIKRVTGRTIYVDPRNYIYE